MSLSQPRSIYGIHSVSPYSRTDGTPYGIMKVLEDSSLNLSGKLVELTGGSSKYPWAVEEGEIKAEVSLKVNEYPDFLFTLFLGQAPTDVNTPDATGTLGALTNKFGTSVMNSTTGIASVGIKSSTGSGLLKFGKYIVKAKTSTTVDVYCLSDADFARGGTAQTYLDDTLKIASSLAVTTGGALTDIGNTGVQIVGGSGSIAMTVGDTATFTVLPPSTKSMSVVIGGVNASFPEFGMLCMAKKKGTGELFEIDVYRCKGQGLPLGLAMNAFSKAAIKLDAFYDSTLDGVFSVRNLVP